MEIIFAPFPKIILRNLVNKERASESRKYIFRPSTAKIDISLPDGATDYAHRYIQFLKQLIQDTYPTVPSGIELNGGIEQKVKLEFGLFLNVATQKTAGKIIVYFDRVDTKSYMARLFQIFGDRAKDITAAVDFKLELLNGTEEATKVHAIIGLEGLKFRTFNNSFGYREMFDVDEAFQQSFRDPNAILTGTLYMKLKLDHETLQFLRAKKIQDPLETNRKMLNESISADAVIITGTGAEVKCHKGFLAAHSPVFKAMFESTMREGSTGTVEIPEMTEAGVRALLAYLYCWDTVEASKSCSIALELLIAADKYNIKNLEVEVRELLLSKDDQWFDVSVALQLLQFARKRADIVDNKWDHNKMMEEKATAVIQSKSAVELRGCPEFQQLFSEPDTGMDICVHMITTGNKRFRKSTDCIVLD